MTRPNLDALLPPGERERRQLFAALGLVRPVTMSLHPPGLVAQRVRRTLPALLTEAVMQWRARERSRRRVVDTLDAMQAEAMSRHLLEPFAPGEYEVTTDHAASTITFHYGGRKRR